MVNEIVVYKAIIMYIHVTQYTRISHINLFGAAGSISGDPLGTHTLGFSSDFRRRSCELSWTLPGTCRMHSFATPCGYLLSKAKFDIVQQAGPPPQPHCYCVTEWDSVTPEPEASLYPWHPRPGFLLISDHRNFGPGRRSRPDLIHSAPPSNPPKELFDIRCGADTANNVGVRKKSAECVEIIFQRPSIFQCGKLYWKFWKILDILELGTLIHFQNFSVNKFYNNNVLVIFS